MAQVVFGARKIFVGVRAIAYLIARKCKKMIANSNVIPTCS